jgi:ribose transport system ATP-binding protein
MISNSDILLSTSNLSKTFPSQAALDNVNLKIARGEIQALLGQNGSGKSTLIKVLAGIHTPDSGSEVNFDGAPLAFGSPRESHRRGLRFVHQALGVINELSAIENISLGFGYRKRRNGLIDWSAQREKTRNLLQKLHLDFDIDIPAGRLRPVDRSAIAISRALDEDEGISKLLILDEPTAALPPAEVEVLFSLIRKARESGTTILYVSHRLDEVLEIADRASVLRDGCFEGTEELRNMKPRDIIQMVMGASDGTANRRMLGDDVSETVMHVNPGHLDQNQKEPSMVFTGLVSSTIKNIDFKLGKGEILGIAGLTGSGREEFASALVGAVESTLTVEFADGTTLVNPTPRTARVKGIVLVLPNRAVGASAKELTVKENIVLPIQGKYSQKFHVSKHKELKDVRKWIDLIDIRPRDPERAYALLSGGNQQKVIFAKWLNTEPRLMVLDDPTSGVDIGARQVIYELVRKNGNSGTSFIVCSSDTDDLVALCDRILILRDGVVSAELQGKMITDVAITSAMLTVNSDSESDRMLRTL